MAKDSDFFSAKIGGKDTYLNRDMAQYEAVLDKLSEKSKKAFDDATRAYNNAVNRLKGLAESSNKELRAQAEEAVTSSYNTLISAESAYQEDRIKNSKHATDISNKYTIEAYKKFTIAERREHNKKLKQQVADSLAYKKVELKNLEEESKNIKGRKAQEEHNKKIDALKEDITNRENFIKSSTQPGFSKLELLLSSKARQQNKDTKLEQQGIEASLAVSSAEENVKKKQDALDAEQALVNRYEKLKQSKSAKARALAEKNLTAHQKRLEELDKEHKEAEAELQAAHNKEELVERKKQNKKITDALKKDAAALANAAAKAVDKSIDDIYGNQSKMQARLQGTELSWQEALDKVSTNVGLSGVASQQKVIKKMETLIDSGVAYNVELRSYLAEVTENIASTFNAFDGTLLRMIRLQQADTTAARLGMEASLTKLFNEYFKDTSYLSDVSDTITQAILDASATLPRDDSLEFEYTVQKWLGALYSLGASSTALSTIAQGINYLGTGNYQGLGSNSALLNLFALSASRSGGKSYDQLLNQGLTAEDTNTLLKSMIELLAEIANNQTNMVTKSSYAELFGMSVTDLSTFASLTSTEISNLYKSAVNYQGLVNETESQIQSIWSRKNITQIVNTVIENATTQTAQNLGSNALSYGLWKALNLVSDTVGKMSLPGILAAGFGISSEIDILNIAKTGMMGASFLASLVEGIANDSMFGSSSLSVWDAEDYTQRGGGLALLKKGTSSGVSYSAVLGTGNNSIDDLSETSVATAEQNAYDSAGTSSEEIQEGKEVPQKILDALNGEAPSVLSILQEIDDRLDPGRVFYTAIAGVLRSDAVNQITNLSTQIASASSKVETQEQQEKSEPINSVVNNTTPMSGSSGTSTEVDNAASSQYITDAVEAALRNFINQYALGLPVNLTGGIG